MTRKDYILLADAIKEAYRTVEPLIDENTSPTDAIESAFHHVRAEVSRVLASDNPRFDRQRFETACDGNY